MKIILTLSLVLLFACHRPEKKETSVRTNRTGDTFISIYNPKNNKDKYWYVILCYKSNVVYYYYTSSKIPITDFFIADWKKIIDLPDELINKEPNSVITVPLSELPASVDVSLLEK